MINHCPICPHKFIFEPHEIGQERKCPRCGWTSTLIVPKPIAPKPPNKGMDALRSVWRFILIVLMIGGIIGGLCCACFALQFIEDRKGSDAVFGAVVAAVISFGISAASKHALGGAMEINEQSPPPETGAKCEHEIKSDGESWGCIHCGKTAEEIAPETGAVDVVAIAKHICNSFRKWEMSGAGSHVHVYEALKPLTKRITQLEQENERLKSVLYQWMPGHEYTVENAKELLRNNVDEKMLFLKRAESANYMGNLLAIVHGDGGHYRAEHGNKKATDDAIEIVVELKKNYNELIYAVAQKFPEETRHQTALRYIMERETQSSSAQSASLPSPAKSSEPRSPDTGACNPASTSDTGARTPTTDS